ncbi:glycoside hydrolase family 76 protein [Nakamurella sp. A5-74]|uniref:Glycoside hydrolase family 76 protein n=1 Tax=Nakamurella sp. A5-74 TaxID=3158264 RepID=A0AAU8DR84_9ACTN
MRSGLRSRLATVLAAATVLTTAGCGTQAPSDLPAVDTLVRFYDVGSGVWPTTGWWNSANALTALADHMLLSGDRRYVWVLGNTWSLKRHALQGNFVNSFLDDTGWWALAWIRAYDLTGDRRYLDTARAGVDHMWRYRDDACGGGLWWTNSRTYKNAITNELFIKAAAELSVRVGDTRYLDQAVQVWKWFDASGMINDDLLVNDGLSDCRNNGGTTWTYNQGVVLGALVALAEASGDDAYLERARAMAGASIAADSLHQDGILVEPCEPDGCNIDQQSFKGIYVRNLGELDRALTDHPFNEYLAEQAASAFAHDRSADSGYGLRWAGPPGIVTGATQQSAVDLLVAARPIPADDTSSNSPTSGSGTGGSVPSGTVIGGTPVVPTP